MQNDYRGHLIRLVEGDFWRAELVELDSGALLPTFASASASEGIEVCAQRARALIDLYLRAQARMDELRRN